MAQYETATTVRWVRFITAGHHDDSPPRTTISSNSNHQGSIEKSASASDELVGRLLKAEQTTALQTTQLQRLSAECERMSDDFHKHTAALEAERDLYKARWERLNQILPLEKILKIKRSLRGESSNT